MKSKLAVLALAFLIAPFFVAAASAQSSGVIQGTVKDDKGEPIKDVVVRIEGMNVKRKYKVKTNKKGKFMHIGINIQGTYRVIAEKEGYQGDFANGVRPGFDRSDDKGKIDLVMKPGRARQLAFEMTDEQIAELKRQQENAEKAARQNAALQETFNAGVEAFNGGDMEAALVKFRESSELAPQEPNTWSNLARTQARLKKHEEALESYQKALDLKPNDANILQNMGSSYAATGQPEKAKEFYGRAIESAAATDPKTAANSLYNMAVSFINSGKDRDAEEALIKAVEADPQHAEAHFQLGIVQLGLNKIDECVGHLETYLKLNPNGPNASIAQELVASFKE